MSFARFVIGLLLASLAVVNGAAIFPNCSAAQLDTIKNIAQATPLANYLGICNVVGNYEIYPFKTPPNGALQDSVCSHLFCRTALKVFYWTSNLPKCYLDIDGDYSWTPNAHFQRICPKIWSA